MIKSYLITDSSYYDYMDGSAYIRFKENFLSVYNKSMPISFAAFRYANHAMLDDNEFDVLKTFIELCVKYDIEPIVNLSSFKIEILSFLHKYGIRIGLHFKENDIDMLDRNVIDNIDGITFYSAHNLSSARYALNLGIDYITISPIFYDKGNKALGIEFLRQMPDEIKCRCFALGGVNSINRINLVAESGVFGFASISYFSQYCL